jgi:hypothetical protein
VLSAPMLFDGRELSFSVPDGLTLVTPIVWRLEGEEICVAHVALPAGRTIEAVVEDRRAQLLRVLPQWAPGAEIEETTTPATLAGAAAIAFRVAFRHGAEALRYGLAVASLRPGERIELAYRARPGAGGEPGASPFDALLASAAPADGSAAITSPEGWEERAAGRVRLAVPRGFDHEASFALRERASSLRLAVSIAAPVDEDPFPPDARLRVTADEVEPVTMGGVPPYPPAQPVAGGEARVQVVERLLDDGTVEVHRVRRTRVETPGGEVSLVVGAPAASGVRVDEVHSWVLARLAARGGRHV